MRNRAKCKLCSDIIESFHRYDFVKCSCDEISVDGGTHMFRCGAKNWDNFLRVDDEGNEKPVKVQDGDEKVEVKEEMPAMTRADLLAAMKTEIEMIENLPEQALKMPVSQFELWKVISMVYALMNS